MRPMLRLFIILLAFIVVDHTVPNVAQAREISKKHKRLLDTRLGAQYSTYAQTDARAGQYGNIAQTMARRYGVPPDLFLKLIKAESNWDLDAVSPKGAIGLTQLMPATARILGVNPHDPHQNLEGGARYLAEQYERFSSWRLALAAYNAGPGAVEKYNGVPPYKETQNYIRRILGNS